MRVPFSAIENGAFAETSAIGESRCRSASHEGNEIFREHNSIAPSHHNHRREKGS
jgi:hypothetical protein